MTKTPHMPCKQFIDTLASKQPVPGGGGAAAMGGAIGMALGNMVGNLTLGKKKYAMYENEIQRLISQGDQIKNELMDLIDQDAAAFKPLLQAYGLSRDNPEQVEFRKKTIEKRSMEACLIPMAIMQKAYEGIQIHARMNEIGTSMAISDVGCGVAFLKAALISAHLNVLINLRSIQDESFLTQHLPKIQTLLANGTKIADQTLNKVTQRITNNH